MPASDPIDPLAPSYIEAWRGDAFKRLSVPAHDTSVITCLLLHRGHIFCASDDHSITMYSPVTGELERSFEGHSGGVWAVAIASQPTSPEAADSSMTEVHEMLVSGSTDRTLRIWNLETGRNVHVFGGHTSTVRCVVVAHPVWVEADDESGRQEKWPKTTMIVTGSRDCELRAWRLPPPGKLENRSSDGEEERENPDENPYFVHSLRGHEGAVRSVAVHGRTVVSGSYDGTARVWNLVTGEQKFVLTGHTQKVYSGVIDHVRKQTCSGSMDGTVRIWSLKDGSCRHILSGHTSLIGLLSISATALVSAAADATLRIWDLNNGSLLHTLTGHQGAITGVQHDNDKVLSGSDGVLRMWDTRDGSVTRDLLTGVTGVWQVAFDRRFCVAATNREDRTFLDVWDFEYKEVKEDERSGYAEGTSIEQGAVAE